MPSDWSEEKAKSAMIKASWKDKFFSYSWVFERFMFSFIFEKTSSSLPMLFVHIEKSSSENLRNSRLQMFFKIGVRKKHLCSSFFLIKLGPWKPVFLLKKKIFQHRCFPVNIANFLVEQVLFIIVMIRFCGRLWVQYWCVSYFLYYCFVILHIGSP